MALKLGYISYYKKKYFFWGGEQSPDPLHIYMDYMRLVEDLAMGGAVGAKCQERNIWFHTDRITNKQYTSLLDSCRISHDVLHRPNHPINYHHHFTSSLNLANIPTLAHTPSTQGLCHDFRRF